DSYKLAKLLRLNELPEVHLPSRESDSLRSLVRYRKSIGEDITALKNRVHSILTKYGISVDRTDIFGRIGMMDMERSSSKLNTEDRFVLKDILERMNSLMDEASTVEEEMSRMAENNRYVKLLMTIPGINLFSLCNSVADR
ncbi:MAG: transposase, partial [Candidatus Micrarchaeaceae archaeon]